MHKSLNEKYYPNCAPSVQNLNGLPSAAESHASPGAPDRRELIAGQADPALPHLA
jgi:hypothetical protein